MQAAGADELLPVSLGGYARSLRWVGHLYIGSVGAAVNVEAMSRAANVAGLAVAAVAVLADDLVMPHACAAYLAKTMAGDLVAGKLDTLEWRAVLAFVGALAAGVVALSGAEEVLAGYGRILAVLALSQAVCELGDARLEHLAFFRHRYSFELSSLLAMLALPGGITPRELAVVQVDLMTCFAYRAANALITAHKRGLFDFRALCGDDLVRGLLFAAFGALRGERVVSVRGAREAFAVLRASADKGDLLERNVASPAWQPVLSLESVDGPLHAALIADFHALVRDLPGLTPANVAAVARRNCEQLLARVKRGGENSRVVADDVARLSLATYVECIFGRAWEEAFEPLLTASWEWRREIAVRGRADARLKDAAVRVLVDDLLRSHAVLWARHGEGWRNPRRYSVLLQPVLLSPAINAGDIAVAIKRAGPHVSLEAAVRRAHPFPILERRVTEDVVLDGKVVVKAPAQVVIFASDLARAAEAAEAAQAGGGAGTAKGPWGGTGIGAGAEPYAWSIFGAGPRSCVGAHLALPLLRELRALYVACEAEVPGGGAFDPECGHRHSGRHNDANWTLAEMAYFATTVGRVLWRGGGFDADAALAAADEDGAHGERGDGAADTRGGEEAACPAA